MEFLKTDSGNRLSIVLLAFCIALLLLVILIMAAVPPVSRDALTHHLAVPKLWIINGGMVEIPDLVFSYYPMNLDLLYVVPLLLGNDIIPKYIHLLFGLATAGLIYTYLKEQTNRVLSLLGVLLFLSIPAIVKLSITVYVDLGLVLFSWVSIIYLFKWARSPKSTKYIIISAVSCGLCLGTKYNGMVVLFLLTFSFALVYIRSNDRKKYQTTAAVGFAALFFCVAMIVFSPWMIRNLQWTGNPIYPLYNQQITGEETDEIDMKPWVQRKLIYHETALETALIPVRIFFQGQDDNPRFFDGKLNPILFIFPLLSFIGFKRQERPVKTEMIVLSGFTIFFILYASFIVDMRIRYISPILPPLVVLTIWGIKNAYAFIANSSKEIKTIINTLLTVGVAVFLLQNFKYVQTLFTTVQPLSFLSGQISREDYIEKFRPEYPVIQAANRILGDDARILALFVGNRRYYFDKDVEFSLKKFKEAVDASTGESMLANKIRRNGYTHIILGIDRFKSWAMNTMQDEQRRLINTFFEYRCRFVHSENGYFLFEIVADTDH